jgi:hypothetical protein
MGTNKKLKEFVIKEINKLHKITLLENKKMEIESQLNLLEKDIDESALTDYNDKEIKKYYDSQNKKARKDIVPLEKGKSDISKDDSKIKT